MSTLIEARTELQNVLAERTAGSDRAWLDRVEPCLARLEQAARQHLANLGDDGENAGNGESSLQPSPKVARRTEALRQELEALRQEAATLRGQAQTVHPVAAPSNPRTAAGALSVAPEAAEIADFGVFYERLEQMLHDFEHFDEDETDMIQESVNLDLGAGD